MMWIPDILNKFYPKILVYIPERGTQILNLQFLIYKQFLMIKLQKTLKSLSLWGII